MFFYLIPVVAGLILVWFAVLSARAIPGLWMTSERFNSTADWTPVARYGPTTEPPATSFAEFCLRIITPQLEAGETLEGFARGFFYPPRPRDWMLRGILVPSCPLLIAVTSRRMLLFEVTIRMTVCRSRFIGYDAIQSLHPPKPGPWGTSGRLKFGLSSGVEYQLGFLGPLIDDEGMRHEQRLATYLRWMAPRYSPSRAPHALTPQSTL